MHRISRHCLINYPLFFRPIRKTQTKGMRKHINIKCMIEEKHDPHNNRIKNDRTSFTQKDKLTVYDILNHTPAAERNDIIENALDDIRDYCSKLPDDSKKSQRCWIAYNFFCDELEKCQNSCNLERKEGKTSDEGCMTLNHWESFIRTLQGNGGTKAIIKTLYKLQKKDENIEETGKVPSTNIVNSTGIHDNEETRKYFEELFNKMDHNHDGKLDVEEFRNVMRMIGDELSGEMVGLIFESLDLHGFVNFEDFLTILEAEQIRSHSKLAGFLRLSQKHGHAYDQPRWLQDIE